MVLKALQINGTITKDAWSNGILRIDGDVDVVVQTGTFPEKSTDSFMLFDTSGGRGKLPDSIPSHPGYTVGYSGGINPENVVEYIQRIPGLEEDSKYWIDMESGVRTNNWLDLNKCEEVCKKIWR